MQLKKQMSDRTFLIVCCIYAALAFGLFLSTAYLVDGTYNPFLYFRF